MKKEFLECGKITGTHGIRGILRAVLWCDSAKFLEQFCFLYLNENGGEPIKLISAKEHGNICLLKFENYDTVEQAEQLRNRIFYIKRDDAVLKPGTYFISELLGCEVNDAQTGEFLGKITDVYSTVSNDVWTLNKNGKNFEVPIIDGVITSVDVENGKAIIKPLKGTFDDEN